MSMLKRLILICCAIFLCAEMGTAVVIPDGVYYIFSEVDGHYVIDDSGSRIYNGNNIHIWKMNETKAQQWKVENRNGAIIIRSAINNSYVIDNNGSIVRNGNNIHLWEYNGTNAQRWYPEKVSGRDNVYVLRSALNSRYVIDLNGSGAYDGNNIQLYEYNGSKAQKWCFITAADIDLTDLLWDLFFGD